MTENDYRDHRDHRGALGAIAEHQNRIESDLSLTVSPTSKTYLARVVNNTGKTYCNIQYQYQAQKALPIPIPITL